LTFERRSRKGAGEKGGEGEGMRDEWGEGEEEEGMR
jgi:hypothetical protein